MIGISPTLLRLVVPIKVSQKPSIATISQDVADNAWQVNPSMSPSWEKEVLVAIARLSPSWEFVQFLFYRIFTAQIGVLLQDQLEYSILRSLQACCSLCQYEIEVTSETGALGKSLTLDCPQSDVAQQRNINNQVQGFITSFSGSVLAS